MYFFTYKIEIYWQVVILLILDFLALARELNRILFCFPQLQSHIGFQNRYHRINLVPRQAGQDGSMMATSGLSSNLCLFLWNSTLTLCYCFMYSRFTQLIEYSTSLKDFI